MRSVTPLSKFLLILVFFLSLFDSYIVYGKGNSESETLILDSAEKFFISLKDGNYKTAWELLSEKSHKTIIDDVYSASKKIGEDIKKEDIIKDFNSNGIRFNRYWNAFVENFDPDLALKKSVWKMGKVKGDKAIIILQMEWITELEMYKEDGRWRVGLVESFWTRKK